MEPGYRSPLIDTFRRGETPEVRLLAAQGDLAATAHEQVALLMLAIDDPDETVKAAAAATLDALPVDGLRAFLARSDAPPEMRAFFGSRGVEPGATPAPDASEPLLAMPDEPGDDEEAADAAGEPPGDAGNTAEQSAASPSAKADAAPSLLSGLPIKRKIKLASKGTREQRAQLIRDPNKLVSAAVLSSPKLTDAEVESFAKMANVAEEVLRVIAMNRSWLKNYGVVLGLVRNPKTPVALSMQLLPRLNERDMKMLTVDRNVPEGLRLAARKFIVKGLK